MHEQTSPAWRGSRLLSDPSEAVRDFGEIAAADLEHWRQRARWHLKAAGSSIADGACDDALHDAVLAIADHVARGHRVHAYPGFLDRGLYLIARRRAENEQRAAALSVSLETLTGEAEDGRPGKAALPVPSSPPTDDTGSLAALALFESLDLALELRRRIGEGSLRLTVSQYRALAKRDRLTAAERKARQHGRAKLEAALRDVLRIAVFGPAGRRLPVRDFSDDAFWRLVARADLFSADAGALVAARSRPYRRRFAPCPDHLPVAG